MQEMWFHAGAGRKAVGPCTREEMLAARASGAVRLDTLVWKAGTEAWVPFADSVLAAAPILPDSVAPVAMVVEAPAAAKLDAGDAGAPSVADLAVDVATTAPVLVEPVATGPVAAAAEAVAVDYGVASPRSFRAGGARRSGRSYSAAATEPPLQPVDDDGWQYSMPVVWRRCFARMFDTLLLGTVIWMALAAVFAAWIPDAYQALYGRVSLLNNGISKTVLTFLVVIPVEAWLLGMTGTTLGKWLFGVRITQANGKPIGFWRALRREGRVFLQGLALGLPLFSLIAMIVAFFRTRELGVSGWDVDQPWRLTGRAPGVAQTCLFIVGVCVVMVALASLRLLVLASKA